MGDGPDTKGPSAEEQRLLQRGKEKYSYAQNLNIGREHLEKMSDVDTSRRTEEALRGGQVNTINQAVYSQDPTKVGVPIDTRAFAGTGSAALAQSDMDNAATKGGLIETSLGRSMNATSAEYAQAQRDQNLYFANQAADSMEASVLPSTVATAGGIYLGGGYDDLINKFKTKTTTVVPVGTPDHGISGIQRGIPKGV